MKVLTFDIEEWYLSQLRYGSSAIYSGFDNCLDTILQKLDICGIRASFFCVGEMGRLFPQVIHKIHANGHEIGCHSNVHTWLNKMTVEECRKDTRCAIDSLEQCIGEKVISYRAPAFSISPDNVWTFDILAENGIERDASVFPATRDFGGFPFFPQKTPCVIEYNTIRIKEFPVCTTTLLGRETAYSGGGYFRFFPLSFIQKRIRESEYTMCYFHIADLLPELQGVMKKSAYEIYFKEPGTLKNRYMRYVKSNFGKKSAFGKMMKLFDTDTFIGLPAADKAINWDSMPVVKL